MEDIIPNYLDIIFKGYCTINTRDGFQVYLKKAKRKLMKEGLNEKDIDKEFQLALDFIDRKRKEPMQKNKYLVSQILADPDTDDEQIDKATKYFESLEDERNWGSPSFLTMTGFPLYVQNYFKSLTPEMYYDIKEAIDNLKIVGEKEGLQNRFHDPDDFQKVMDLLLSYNIVSCKEGKYFWEGSNYGNERALLTAFYDTLSYNGLIEEYPTKEDAAKDLSTFFNFKFFKGYFTRYRGHDDYDGLLNDLHFLPKRVK